MSVSRALLLVLVVPACLCNIRGIERGDKHVTQFEQTVQQTLRQGLALNRSTLGSPYMVRGFSWKTCNTSRAAVDLRALSLSDPLKFPGTLTLSVQADVTKDLQPKLVADLKVKKKVFGFYVEIPCVDDVGSCTYDDLCAKIAPLASQCPAQLVKIGIKCKCPVKAGSYGLKDEQIPLPALSVPGGDYEVEVNVKEDGAEIVCLSLEFSVE